MKSDISLFYSIVDRFPAFRVDLSELVAKCLRGEGLNTEWFMNAGAPSLAPKSQDYLGQVARLPPKFGSSNAIARLANKFSYWIADSALIVAAAFRKFDVLQTRDKYIASLVGLLAARLSGKRFVYWCSYPFPEHDLEMAASAKELLPRVFLYLRGKIGFLLLYKLVMRLADHSFVQSEQMLSDLTAYGVPASRMTAVPMGVPAHLLSRSPTPKKVTEFRSIAYIGTLAAVRRLHTLLDAFVEVRKAHPDARLLMVGDGDYPSERLSLESHARTLGIEKSVSFTGFLDFAVAIDIAASAAVCVSPIYPSKVLNCGSPTKLVEYMALGVPVVCNDHPEQSAIIRESGAGICVPWGAAEFAGAINWMLDHPGEAAEMGKKGPTWVATNRTYPIIAKQVWRTYQKILGRDS